MTARLPSKPLFGLLAVLALTVIVGRIVVKQAIAPREAAGQMAFGGPEAALGPAGDADGPCPSSRPVAESRAERGRMITGRVVDRGGIPLTHAKVAISLKNSMNFPDFATALSFDATVDVDKNACFEAKVPANGTYLVVAEASGFAPGWRERVAPGEDVDLVLDVPCRISGTALRADSREPVAGVFVDVALDDPLFLRVKREAVTSADGSFELRDLPPGKAVVRAAWNGHSSWADDVVLQPGGTAAIEVPLDPGVGIEGRVIELETWRPIAGAMVAADTTQAEADGYGAFRLEGLRAGLLQVSVHAKGWHCGSATVTIASGRPQESVVVALARAPVYHGVVLDDGGEPVPGARVYCPGDMTQTGPDGRFEFTPALDPGVLLTISAYHDGYLESKETFEADPAHELAVRLERCDETISGVVRDSKGDPIADARVKCSIASPFVTGTDSEGAFRFEGCPRRHAVTVSAIAMGFAEATLEVDRAACRVTDGIVMTLEASPAWHPTISGVVVDDAGQPVEGAAIRISEGWGGAKGRGLSQADGRFTVQADYPAGKASMYVEANAEGFEWSGWSTPSSPDEFVTLTLERYGSVTGRVVDGATGEPIAAATVYVCTFLSREREGSTSESGEFKIAAPPGKCQVRVSVDGYAFEEPRHIEVVPGAMGDAGTMALVRGGAIEGVIRATLATPRRKVVLASPDRAKWVSGGETDDLGLFRIDDSPVGSWEVFAWVEAGVNWSRTHHMVKWCSIGTVEVTPGGVSRVDGVMRAEHATLDVTLTATSSQSEVVPTKGPPDFTALPADSESDPERPPGFELTIQSLDRMPLAVSDADSPFPTALVSRWAGEALHTQWSLPIFAAGRYRLTLSGDGRDAVTTTVALMAGERRAVTLALPAPR